MDFTVENLCGFLIRSRLMTPEEMRTMYQRWAETRGDGSVASFTRWLVANNYVTEYQASLLTKGHSDTDAYFLGKYKILDRIGRGRMAGVYRAIHALGQIVAIKVLPPSQAKNPQMLGRFQREARLSLKLAHPNVVRSFQVGVSGALQYIVMEYLEGETLEEVLQRRKLLPPGEAVRLVHQALLGLEHIHELGMVHRDLKPANLMLTPAPAAGDPDTTLNSTVKILDIGLGRELFDDRPAHPGANPIELTSEGTLLGTPDYLAPEQARDARAVDIRADIYGLGCVLYHALAGQPPFRDKNLLNQMVRHATETPRPLKDFNPAIADGLQQIVNWMLAKKPEQRYATPERAAQALEVFLRADAPAAKPLEVAPQMRKYLTWLETDAVAESKLPPSAENILDSPAEIQANPRKGGKANRHRKPGARAHDVPLAKPYVPPSPASPSGPIMPLYDEYDVELVEMPGAEKPADARIALPGFAPDVEQPLSRAMPVSRSILGLSRRDWMLIGIGAGVLLGLVAIVFLALYLLRT